MAKKPRSKTNSPPRRQPRKTPSKTPPKAQTQSVGVHPGGSGTEIRRASPMEVRTTGRFIASARSLDKETVKQMLERLGQAGLRDTCDAASFAAATGAEAMLTQARSADMLLLHEFGVAILNVDPERVERASLEHVERASPYTIEPEYISYAGARMEPEATGLESTVGLPSLRDMGQAGVLSRDFLLGYQAGVNQLVSALLGSSSTAGGSIAAAESLAVGGWEEDGQATWGLRATGVLNTSLTGAGVRVAILDSGIDPNHPDLAGRIERAVSCVPGLSAHDRFGHGTHCAGTACGPQQPTNAPRYGVAPSAALVSVKVLNDNGEGRDGDIVTGMYWAQRAGCRVINLSIHRRVAPAEGYLMYYQNAAQTILNAGGVVVSIAGNHSDRTRGRVAPVSSPANCPGVLAVGAIDQAGVVGNFSNRTINGSGGEVDFVAPGVQVFSSFPGATRYARKNGTSMAAPHVAGMIALLLEADPGMNGNEIYQRLRMLSQTRPGWDPYDCGYGLPRVN